MKSIHFALPKKKNTADSIVSSHLESQWGFIIIKEYHGGTEVKGPARSFTGWPTPH